MGLGIARACAKEGMNIVIADIRREVIDKALPEFKAAGWPVLGLELDVTDRTAYAKAADAAEAEFGNVHLLVNNAGIACKGGPMWNASFKETDLAVAVNFTAILNGIQTFVPRMLKHGEESFIVSTSSKAGLLAVVGCGLYNATKQGVIGIMETLAMDLEGTNIGAGVFCPGGYKTDLGNSSNFVNTVHLGVDAPPPLIREDGEKPILTGWDDVIRDADDAGVRVVRGVKRGDLYILTHSEFKKGVESRMNAMLRAFPDEPPLPKYAEVFPYVVYNPIFDKQTQVPALGED